MQRKIKLLSLHPQSRNNDSMNDLVAQLVEQMTLNHWVEGSSPPRSHDLLIGKMAEWSIAAVLKTVELRGSRGSNPCLSAESPVRRKLYGIFCF